MKNIISLTLCLSLLLMASSCSLKKNNINTSNIDNIKYLDKVEVAKIQKGIQEKFELKADVLAYKSSNILPEIQADISDIYVKTGDFVKNGDLIVKLKSNELSSNLNTANQAFNNVKISANESNKLYAENIKSAQIALDSARNNLRNLITQNNKLKIQAEEALNTAKLSINLNSKSYQDNLDNSVKNALNTVLSASMSMDKIIGVSNNYKSSNDSYENLLGATDHILKVENETMLKALLKEIDEYEESYDNIIVLLKDTEKTLKSTLSLLENSINSSKYTLAQLNLDKNTITQQLSVVRQSISNLELINNNLNSLEQKSNGNYQAVINAEASYESTLERIKSSESAARKAVESAEQALKNTKQSQKLNQASMQSSISSAHGNYEHAIIYQNKVNIYAPFDGVVTNVYLNKGDKASPSSPILKIEDDSQFKIVFYVSQKDLKKFNINQEILIKNINEKAKINSISPSADPISKNYKIEALISSEKLKSGETVTVNLSNLNSISYKDKIFIPISSLHILENEMFVWTLKDSKTHKNTIKIGEIIGNYVEVLSGLNIGDNLIISGARLIEKENTEVEVINKINN